MRFFYGILIALCAMSPAIADQAIHRNVIAPVTDLSEFSGASGVSRIEWNNQRPEQQRALNQF